MVEPPLPLLSIPTPWQVETDEQDIELSPPTVLGSRCGIHDVPPSLELRATPAAL
jgi:hypothetical protein